MHIIFNTVRLKTGANTFEPRTFTHVRQNSVKNENKWISVDAGVIDNQIQEFWITFPPRNELPHRHLNQRSDAYSNWNNLFKKRNYDVIISMNRGNYQRVQRWPCTRDGAFQVLLLNIGDYQVLRASFSCKYKCENVIPSYVLSTLKYFWK